MACDGTKISELTVASDSQDTDKFVIERSLANRAVTKRSLRQAFKNESLPTQVTGELLRWSAAAEYDGAVNYAAGDTAKSAGVLYICKAANGPATAVKAVSDTDYWVPDGSVVTGDWTPRTLTRAAPTDGQIPRWSTDTLNGGGAADWVAESPRWHKISVAKYTAAPTGPPTATLLCSDTSDFAKGLPIKFTIASVDYYAIITAVTTNTSITIAGAPFSGTLTALYVGTPEMIFEETWYIHGTYYAGSDIPLLLRDNAAPTTASNQFRQWNKANARLVRFGFMHTGATVAQPRITPVIGAIGGTMNPVSSDNTSTGPTLSNGAWVYNSAVGLNSTGSYGQITFGQDLDFYFTRNGSSSGSGADLNIICAFVFE